MLARLFLLALSVSLSAESWAQDLDALRKQAEATYASRELAKSVEIGEQIWAAAAHAGDRSAMAYAQWHLGRVYTARADYERALEAFDKALPLYTEIGDQTAIGEVLTVKAIATRYTGNVARALDLHRQAVAIHEKGTDAIRLGNSYLMLGNAYNTLSDHVNAIDVLQRAIRLFEELHAEGPLANALNSLGNAYHIQGSTELALELFERSLEIRERISSNYYSKIVPLVNMAGSLRVLRRFDEARQRLDRALQLAPANDPRARSQILEPYGLLLIEEGKYEEALVRLNEALPIFEVANDQILKTDTLIALARAQALSGRLREAAVTAGQALEIAERARSPYLQVQALEIRGSAARGLKENEKALADFLKLAGLSEEMRRGVAGGPAEQQAFLKKVADGMHGAVEMLFTLGRHEEAFKMAEHRKGQALLSVLGDENHRLTVSLTPAERGRETLLNDTLADANSRLAILLQDPEASPAGVREAEEAVRQSRLELTAFEGAVYAAHPELRMHRNQVPPVSVKEAASVLPDSRTLLLEYDLGPDKSFLFTLARGADGNPIFNVHELKIKGTELIERAKTFRAKIADRDLDFRGEARKLFDVLIAPAAAELAGKDTLIVVPDAALWQLPFQALEDRSDRALLENYALSFAPSMTVLSQMLQTRPAGADQRTELSAIGDPAVGRELRALAGLYGADRSRILLGKDATESLARSAAAQSRVVHFAAHGFYDDKHPMFSYLQLSPEKTGTDDGRLEARELMTLGRGADVVVLSACETARGDAGGGEGLVGMTWALMVAGVPTTVASQWKVDSGSTANLMVRFHSGLNQQFNPAHALSKAKTLQQSALAIMRMPQYRHPFYWAGFVMVGLGF